METKEWFVEVQGRKEYYKPYLEAIQPLMLRPIEVTIYNRLPFSYRK